MNKQVESRWKPGQSGNPRGRTPGARQKLTESFIGDLHKKWQADGEDILERVAKDDPKAIVQAMTQLMPKDVALSVTQALPGNMPAADWSVMMEIVRTVRDNAPAGNPPTELLDVIAETTRMYFAKLVSNDTVMVADPVANVADSANS